MKLKTGILIISLVIGLLGVPSCIFAQEYQDTSSNTVLKSSSPAVMQLNALNPEVKGGGGGGRGGGSSSSKSSSSKTKKGDVDDDGNDTGSSSGSSYLWLIALLGLGIFGILIFYYAYKKGYLFGE